MKLNLSGLKQVSAVALIIAAASTGCISPGEKRQIKDDLFSVKKEVLTLKKDLSNKSATIDQQEQITGRRLSEAKTTADQVAADLAQLRGQIDMLKEGFASGRLPGTPKDEPSIAGRLESIEKQIARLEATQFEMITLVEKIAAKSKSKGKVSRRKPIANLSDEKSAFRNERYLYVASDVPALMKKAKGSTRLEYQFYYAESLYKLGRLPDAALEFNELLERKPKNRRAHINMRLGDCFRHLGDKQAAHAYYSTVISSFPGSSEAKRSEKFLDKLAAR